MENRIKELEMLVSVLQEQINRIQRDLSYMLHLIDDNCKYIEQEEKSKILS